MWFAFTVAASAAEPAPAPEPDRAAELEAAARRHRQIGAAEVAGGAVALAGGLGLLLVGRGPPTEASRESETTRNLRGFGGGLLAVGGMGLLLVGYHELVDAPDAPPKPLALTLGPGAVGLVGRF